jgi:hypothetical protein
MANKLVTLYGPLHDFKDICDNQEELIVCGLVVEATDPIQALDILGKLLHRHVVNVIPADNDSGKVAIQWCDKSFSIIFEWGLTYSNQTRIALDSLTYDRIQKESSGIQTFSFPN